MERQSSVYAEGSALGCGQASGRADTLLPPFLHLYGKLGRPRGSVKSTYGNDHVFTSVEGAHRDADAYLTG